jgi:hypothetical protein
MQAEGELVKPVLRKVTVRQYREDGALISAGLRRVRPSPPRACTRSSPARPCGRGAGPAGGSADGGSAGAAS